MSAHPQQSDVDGDEPRRVQPTTESAPAWVTQELIEQTIRVFQPIYGPLTTADAIEIIYNAGRLIEIVQRSSP